MFTVIRFVLQLNSIWAYHTLILCICCRFLSLVQVYLRALNLRNAQQDVHSRIACLCLHTGNWDAYEFCLRSYQKPSVMTIPSHMNWPQPTVAFTTHLISHIPSSYSPILPHNNEDKIVMFSHKIPRWATVHKTLRCLGCGFALSGPSTSVELCGKPLESCCPPCRYITHHGVRVWCHSHNREGWVPNRRPAMA